MPVSIRRASRGQKAVCNPEICLEKKRPSKILMHLYLNKQVFIICIMLSFSFPELARTDDTMDLTKNHW